ncbi:MAG TPA: LapA family protein [Beijerinckiaceae bacterium]|jgi:uncharacterized membrane protein YciS (DUF1049 family)|nr:hypothetical protein [Microvirga sp.]HZB36481.1 LapA family protein [Beijerinckiaceae bacterium]
MRQFLKALILLPIAVVVVLLAVANRAPVTLSFDPFSKPGPLFSTTMPLFALLFIALAIGVVIGGAAAWLAQSKHRRLERRYRREARRLRDERERLRTHPGGSGVPALVSEPSRL